MQRAVPPFCLLLSLYFSALVAQPASEHLDTPTIAKIRDEGLNRSQVMDHISWLSDVYGPRLTGSPAILQASDWVLKKLKEWGLVNGHRETWAFGKGWALVRFGAHMISPQVQPLIGVPGSWTPGTKGTITADVVRVRIDSDADFEKYRGQLAGKIALTQPERPVPMLEGPIVHRMGEKDFVEASTVPPARGRGAGGATQAFAVKVAQFLKAEGVVAIFNRGSDNVMYTIGSDLSAVQQHPD